MFRLFQRKTNKCLELRYDPSGHRNSLRVVCVHKVLGVMNEDDESECDVEEEMDDDIQDQDSDQEESDSQFTVTYDEKLSESESERG